jgi:hypothetical protein
MMSYRENITLTLEAENIYDTPEVGARYSNQLLYFLRLSWHSVFQGRY